MKYAVIIERDEGSFTAYAPDLPGCVATGATREEVLQRMAEAVGMYVARLRADGIPVPEPGAELDYVSV